MVCSILILLLVLVYRARTSLLQFIQTAHPPKVGSPDLECSGGFTQCAALMKPLMSGIECSSMPDSVTQIMSAENERPIVLSSKSFVPLPTLPCALAYKMEIFLSVDVLLRSGGATRELVLKESPPGCPQEGTCDPQLASLFVARFSLFGFWRSFAFS